METDEKNLQRMNNDEIDLAEVLRQVWAGRWIILITTVVFFAIAVIYLLYGSYTGTKEYESQATLMVESPSPDSLIIVLKSPLFLSEVLKTNLSGLKSVPTLSVAQVLDRQTKPPQGNLAGLTNRINAKKGSPGTLVITVMMQDQSAATQLTDSVVQKLTQFLWETQIKRAEKNQKMLAEDSSKNFQVLRERSAKNLQVLRESSSRNLLYLSKGASNNIQFLTKGAAKNIQFQTDGSANNIQFQTDGSAKNIQFLTEGYLQAESIYLQSHQALADFYNRNSKNPGSIDSLEVKRLNSDIKLKYIVYSGIYQQLEQAKIDAKKQYEQAKLDTEKQLGQAKLDAEKQLGQGKLDAEKQLEQAKIDAEKQLGQAKLDAEKQFEQKKIDATKQIEQVALDAMNKVPVIKVLEPATGATQLNVPKTKKVLLLMVFFGFAVGIGIVYGKKFYDKNFTENAKR